MRRAMVGLDDPLLTRVVAVPMKSDNDYILSSASASASASGPSGPNGLSSGSGTGSGTGGGGPSSSSYLQIQSLARPRDRRKRERGVAAVAQLLTAPASEKENKNNKNKEFIKNEREDSTTLIGISNNINNNNSDHDHAPGLLWSSDSARVSESRLSWAVSGMHNHAATTTNATAAQFVTVDQINQRLMTLKDDAVVGVQQPLASFMNRTFDRKPNQDLLHQLPPQQQQLNQQQQQQANPQDQQNQPPPRIPYSRVSVGTPRKNISVTEKPNLADLQQDMTDNQNIAINVAVPPDFSVGHTSGAVAPSAIVDSSSSNKNLVVVDKKSSSEGAYSASSTSSSTSMFSNSHSTATVTAPVVSSMFAKTALPGSVVLNSSGATLSSASAFASPPPVPVVVKKSALALLLNDQGATENPFADEFGFLSGKGEAYPIRIKIYIPTSPTPFDPLLIIIKRDASIEELIGYTLYEYFNKLSNGGQQDVHELLPEDKCDVCCWNLRLVEDDGTIDDDFPALDRLSKMQKSNFDALALCLCTPAQVATNKEARRSRPTNSNRPTHSGSTTGAGTAPYGARSNGMQLGGGPQAHTFAGTGRAPNVPAPPPSAAAIAGPQRGGGNPLPPLPPATANIYMASGIVSAGPAPMIETAPINGNQQSTPNNMPRPPNSNKLVPATNTGREATDTSNSYINNNGPPQKPQVYVKIHLYSTLEVKHTATFAFSAGATMGQVFETICAKRKYDSENYVLKMGDTKTDVALDRILEDMHALEFSGDIFLRPPDEVRPAADRDQLDFTQEEIATIYRQYNVTQKQLLMGRTSERIITLDGEYIHIMSVGDSRTLVDVAKTMTFHISAIVSCLLVKKQSRQFKLVVAAASSRAGSAPTTNAIEFEAGSEMHAGMFCPIYVLVWDS
ncbi:UNVERIFIED_CONTAM: hypothetical protein HDU68_003124 [Siphonaria sp. JEL0065]|nr:hypothetical protein HDU68_003124 [Siphonaria sp. JEL0065]